MPNVKAASRQKSAQPPSEAQLEQILHPELDQDKFTIAERAFRLRVLPWAWERRWRKYALPLLESELKPVETLLTALATGLHVVKTDLQVVESVLRSEMTCDELLTMAVATICISQDPLVLQRAASGVPLTIDEEITL